MLGDKLENDDVQVFLVNTGWTGGSYGTGTRIKLAYTRAMVEAALQGKLDEIETVCDPIFGLYVPTHCPGVPDELLTLDVFGRTKQLTRQPPYSLLSNSTKIFLPFRQQKTASVLLDHALHNL